VPNNLPLLKALKSSWTGAVRLPRVRTDTLRLILQYHPFWRASGVAAVLHRFAADPSNNVLLQQAFGCEKPFELGMSWSLGGPHFIDIVRAERSH